MTRRDFLKVAGVTSATIAVSAALGACGGSEIEETTTSASEASSEAIENASGELEVEKASGQVDSVVCCIEHASFSVAPFGGHSTGRDYFVKHLYGYLFYMPFDGMEIQNCESYLAKSYEKVDEYTYKVELYDYIYDSKGNHITTEDVVFCTELNYSVSGVSGIGSFLDYIEVVDDYNMIFHLKMYGSSVIETLLAGHRCTIVSKAWYESASEDERMYDPACTGPYYLVSYTPGASVVIQARDDYWQKDELRGLCGAANAKTVEFKVISEPTMRTIALQNKEVDMAPIQVEEMYHFYNQETGKNVEGWNTYLAPSKQTHFLFMNMDPGMSPLADDKNLRLAILHAINPRDVYMAAGYNDSTATGCFTLGNAQMGGYNPEWEKRGYYDYDLEKAKEYMAASKHPNGVTLRLIARPENSSMLSLISSELMMLNINVELNLYDQSLFNNYKWDSTQWDIIHDNKGYMYMGQFFYALFNNTSYDNGGVNFLKDDKLYELCIDAMEKNDRESIDAAEAYIYELASCRSLFNFYDVNVAQDGVATLKVHYCVMDPCASEYAADYVSLG